LATVESPVEVVGRNCNPLVAASTLPRRRCYQPDGAQGQTQEKMGKSVREVLEKAVGMGREANERKVEGDDGDKGIMRVYAQLGEE
jgi:hypothetical protein